MLLFKVDFYLQNKSHCLEYMSDYSWDTFIWREQILVSHCPMNNCFICKLYNLDNWLRTDVFLIICPLENG